MLMGTGLQKQSTASSAIPICLSLVKQHKKSKGNTLFFLQEDYTT